MYLEVMKLVLRSEVLESSVWKAPGMALVRGTGRCRAIAPGLRQCIASGFVAFLEIDERRLNLLLFNRGNKSLTVRKKSFYLPTEVG